MNKANRAAQFNAFDALKGLQEALREKEDKQSRVKKRELSEEEQENLSCELAKIERDNKVKVVFYYSGHYVELAGIVKEINVVYHYVVINQAKIFFDDICEIKTV